MANDDAGKKPPAPQPKARPQYDRLNPGRVPGEKPSPIHTPPVGVSTEERILLVPQPASSQGTSAAELEDYRSLVRMTQRLSSILDHEELLDAILDEVIPLANAERGLLILAEVGPDGLSIVRGRDKDGGMLPPDLTKVSLTLAKQCLEQNEMQQYDNLSGRPEMRNIQSIRINELYSAVCLPLKERGTPFGVLYLDSSRITVLPSDLKTELLKAFAAQASVCMVNADLIRKLEDSRSLLSRENQDLRAEVQGGWSFAGMVGRSESMQTMFERLRLVKDLEIPVLLQGESGTGKELVARALHQEGLRANQPFVAVNCGAIPGELFESEFFGHMRGSFTGAVSDRGGLVEQADGGTLFLDEIGDMPLAFQVRLLRFLESGEFRRVGDENAERFANVRIISATHRNLREMIVEKSFREDLFYRLDGVRIDIPPLRDRGDDVSLLIDHYFAKTTRDYPRSIHGISEGARAALRSYGWPGNVRQLVHAIEGATALVPDGEPLDLRQLEIQLEDLNVSSNSAAPVASDESLHNVVARAECGYISATLDKFDWNITKAAKALGISRQHLHNRIRTHDLQRPR